MELYMHTLSLNALINCKSILTLSNKISEMKKDSFSVFRLLKDHCGPCCFLSPCWCLRSTGNPVEVRDSCCHWLWWAKEASLAVMCRWQIHIANERHWGFLWNPPNKGSYWGELLKMVTVMLSSTRMTSGGGVWERAQLSSMGWPVGVWPCSNVYMNNRSWTWCIFFSFWGQSTMVG